MGEDKQVKSELTEPPPLSDDQKRKLLRVYYLLLFTIFFIVAIVLAGIYLILKSVLPRLDPIAFFAFGFPVLIGVCSYCYAFIKRVQRVRFSLAVLMGYNFGLAASITMILSKDPLWITLGIMGLIFIIATITAALARAGGPPLADSSAQK